MDKPPDHDEGRAGTQERSGTPPPSLLTRARGLSPRSRIIAAAAIVALLVALVIAVDAGASSPVVCATCHEMQPWVTSWSVSPHAEVGCYSCHQTPRHWYGMPLSAAERWTRLGLDGGAHLSRSSADTSAVSAVGAAPIPDAACEQCHDPARVGTSRFGVQIKHGDHARRNNSCVSCHRWTAHPDPNGDRDTLLMKQCFTCHSIVKGSKAPGACDACHLKGVDLHPDSHKTGDWLKRHGKVAIADRQQCSMCHLDEFCRNCHGVVMPHPEGWAKGQYSHSVVAKQDRTVCARCHKGSTNLCTMCHHRGFVDKKGPWVRQHSVMASQTGAAFCFQCHGALFCTPCHSSGPASVDGTP